MAYRTASGWDLQALYAPAMHLSEAFLPPYDAIHVGAAAASIPQTLLRALKVGWGQCVPLLVLIVSREASLSQSSVGCGWEMCNLWCDVVSVCVC